MKSSIKSTVALIVGAFAVIVIAVCAAAAIATLVFLAKAFLTGDVVYTTMAVAGAVAVYWLHKLLRKTGQVRRSLRGELREELHRLEGMNRQQAHKRQRHEMKLN